MTRTLPEIAVLPIDRRAAVNADCPEDLRDIFESWIAGGSGAQDIRLYVPKKLTALAEAFAAHREQAEQAEREACALVADAYANTEHDCDDEARTDSAIRIGKRIRGRGPTTPNETEALRTELSIALAANAQLKLELAAEQGTRKQIEAALMQLREQAQEAMAQVDRLREMAQEFTR